MVATQIGQTGQTGTAVAGRAVAPASSGGGVLAGLRVVEFGSIGPGPFCAMMLADHGADVVRVDRAGAGSSITPVADPRAELLHRNRRSIELDLKSDADVLLVRQLIAKADVLLEGNRPGVMERLGLGPADCRPLNAGLIYGRMTGWGQDGPYAGTVAHDLNYLSISGTLSLLGPRDGPPTVPPVVLGDFAGGGMLMAFGIMAALWERGRSGIGQVVDASVLDGSALLATALHGYRQTGGWTKYRQDNLVDGGAPFYRIYPTADGRWLSVAALEERFYVELVRVLGLEEAELPDRDRKSNWPALQEQFGAVVATRTRDEWVAAAAGTNACITAVLGIEEMAQDPHVDARGVLQTVGGLVQPAPAPRFGRSPAASALPPPIPGEHRAEILLDWLGIGGDGPGSPGAPGKLAAVESAVSPTGCG